MDFLTKEDFYSRISERLLAQITSDDNDKLDAAVSMAISKVRDRLDGKYNTALELGKSGDARNGSLVGWVLSISLYLVYGGVPDEEIPARVIKDYDDALEELGKINEGKLSCNLVRVTKDDSEGGIVTRIRIGSNKARSHNPMI